MAKDDWALAHLMRERGIPPDWEGPSAYEQPHINVRAALAKNHAFANPSADHTSEIDVHNEKGLPVWEASAVGVRRCA